MHADEAKEGLMDMREHLSSISRGQRLEKQVGKGRKIAGLLCFALVAISICVVNTGVSLRGYFHPYQEKASRGKNRVRIRIEASQRALEPHQHSAALHAEAEKLRELAATPEKLGFYMSLSDQEKKAWMDEQACISTFRRILDLPHSRALYNISPRLSVTDFLDGDRCQGTTAEYRPLVKDMLAPFQGGFTVDYLRGLRRGPSATMHIWHGQLFLEGSESDLRHPMVNLYADYVYWLLQEVKLPNMVLPVNPDDYPVGRSEPWFSFCRQRRAFNDLLLPNMVEDGLFPVEASLQAARAGRGDTRRAMAVWLGRPMGWARGKREAILREGVAHPERVYAGLTDWENLPGSTPELTETWMQYWKPRIPVDEWPDHFKYVLNVEGNCGSSRLAKQLYADAAVMLVSGEDEEWYFPLLKPFVHFIPVTVRPDGSTDLLDQIAWAEAHPTEVARIVAASTAFARAHLAPGRGRDCYTALLLSEFSRLATGADGSPPPPSARRFVSDAPPRSLATREADAEGRFD